MNPLMRKLLPTSLAAAAAAALLAVGVAGTARATVIGGAASLAGAQSLTLDYAFGQGTHQDAWTSFKLSTVGSGDSSLKMLDADPGGGNGPSSYPPTIHTSTGGMWGLSGNDFAQGNGNHALTKASAVAAAAGDVVYVKMHLNAAYPDFYDKKTISLWINPADTSSEAALGTPAVTFDHLPWVYGHQGYQKLSVTGTAVLSTVVVGGILADVTPSILVANAATSTVTASPSPVPANGVTTTTVTVTLLDGSSVAVPGKTVTLASDRPLLDTISAASGLSSSSGVVTFTVTSLTAGTSHCTATDSTDSVTVSATPSVIFSEPNPVNAGLSTVTAGPTTQVADGAATSTITVTLLDGGSVAVPGKVVTLASDRPLLDTISAASGVSSSSGVVTFTVKSSTAGTSTFTATDSTDTIPVTATASVIFTWPTLIAHAGADQSLTPSSPSATLGGSPAATGGTGTYTSFSWSPSTGLSDASLANPTVTTTTTATTTYTLTVTDSASNVATSTVVVTYGVPRPTYSIDIGYGSPRSGKQDGAYPQTGPWNQVSLNGGGGSNTITVNNLVDGTGTVQPGVSFVFNDNAATYAYFSSATGACMSPDLGQNLQTTGNMNWKFTGLPANTSYSVWGAGWSGGFFAGPAIGTPGQPNGAKYAWGAPLTMTTDATGTLWGSWGDNVNFNYCLLDCMQIQESGSAVSGYATWALAHAGSATAPANDDYNHDGVQNGIAYFMGMDGLATLPSLDASNRVTWTNGGNIASSAYGTQFVVQTSTDLNLWTDVLVDDAHLNNTAGSVSYTLPSGAVRTFCRLSVTPQ